MTAECYLGFLEEGTDIHRANEAISKVSRKGDKIHIPNRSESAPKIKGIPAEPALPNPPMKLITPKCSSPGKNSVMIINADG